MNNPKPRRFDRGIYRGYHIVTDLGDLVTVIDPLPERPGQRFAIAPLVDPASKRVCPVPLNLVRIAIDNKSSAQGGTPVTEDAVDMEPTRADVKELNRILGILRCDD